MLLNLDEKTVQRLGLEPVKISEGKYAFDGIVPARVSDVSVVEQKHEKGEFAGLSVPVLAIEFVNYKFHADEPDRYYTHYIKVVGSKEKVEGTDDQYRNREAADIIESNTEMWKFVKHFLENLTASPNYRDITKISRDDLEKYFDLPILGDAAARLEGYGKFFGYIVSFVKGDGNERKSMIVDKNNLPLPIWVKLLPNYDSDIKRRAKFYAISRFIGQGAFEPMLFSNGQPVPPKIIKVKATESLALIANAAAPAGPGAQIAQSAAQGSQGIDDPAVQMLLKGGK